MKKVICLLLSAVVLSAGLTGFRMNTSAAESTFYINEICSRNSNCLIDSSGSAPDWVELYNSSDEALAIGNYYFTDKKTKLQKYKLPDIEIPAKSYQIIFCGTEPKNKKENEYYTGFAISGNGETVMLTDGINVVDTVTVGSLKADQSFSRVPDGSNDFLVTIPTPGISNNEAKAAAFEAPVFSAKSGFYDNEFDVEITAPEGCKIYYTLDSSDPTEESTEYKGPIHISDASKNENVYSARKDLSAAQQNELIELYCSLAAKKDYHTKIQTPEENIDKCTVLRAICIDENSNKSDITTASYFVGLSDKEEYKNVSVISLVSNPDNLFGYENGIYVLGKDFDDYYLNTLTNPESTDPLRKSYWWWGANYRREDKCQGVFDYFETSDKYTGSDTIDISIKGNGSRGYIEKSINLTANSEYTGRSVLGFNIMSDKQEKGITLFSGGDDYIFKTEDYIAAKLSKDLKVVSFNYKPCQLFLDGEYWGFFYIADRITSKTYFEENYGVDGNDLAIVKSAALDTGRINDLLNYYDVLHSARDNDMSLMENYEYVEQYFDIDSMIDYFCVSIYTGRYDDWPDNNWAVWRCNDISDKKYHDKKWRYIVYDVNSFSMDNPKHDTLSYLLKKNYFFAALYDNADFREKFTKRYYELMNSYTSGDTANQIIREVSENAKPYISENYRRYYGENITVSDYEKRIEELYTFYENRAEFTLSCLDKVNKLYDISYEPTEDDTTEVVTETTIDNGESDLPTDPTHPSEPSIADDTTSATVPIIIEPSSAFEQQTAPAAPNTPTQNSPQTTTLGTAAAKASSSKKIKATSVKKLKKAEKHLHLH